MPTRGVRRQMRSAVIAVVLSALRGQRQAQLQLRPQVVTPEPSVVSSGAVQRERLAVLPTHRAQRRTRRAVSAEVLSAPPPQRWSWRPGPKLVTPSGEEECFEQNLHKMSSLASEVACAQGDRSGPDMHNRAGRCNRGVPAAFPLRVANYTRVCSFVSARAAQLFHFFPPRTDRREGKAGAPWRLGVVPPCLFHGSGSTRARQRRTGSLSNRFAQLPLIIGGRSTLPTSCKH